jgi:hypothetical protein
MTNQIIHLLSSLKLDAADRTDLTDRTSDGGKDGAKEGSENRDLASLKTS